MAENFFYWLFTLALMAGFWFVYVPVVIGLLMPVRWFQGKAVFTERDWLLLFGCPREKVFTLRLWLWFGLGWVGALIIAGRCFFAHCTSGYDEKMNLA
jgi:hypothetical protein